MQTITWHLTTDYTLVWSVWLIDVIVVVAPPQMANPTSLFATTNLTAHDSYFEPIIGILPGRIKGQYLTPVKMKYPSSTFYKYGWIPWFERGENQVQSRQKIASSLVLFALRSFLFPSLSVAFSATSTSTSSWTRATQPSPPTQLLTSDRIATISSSLSLSLSPPHSSTIFFSFFPQLTPTTISSTNVSWATSWTSSSHWWPPC